MRSVIGVLGLCAVACGAAWAAPPPVPSAASVHDAPTDQLQQVVVRATLRRQTVQDVPASVTVLDSATLRAAGEQHFEDVLSLVPNLNWAGGSSRPRFFQIRGIGELQQYQGAPNPSVGFLIDGIDFSGIGMPATLFDVSQIDVLRGPQGTRYGANALAGLISIRTTDPQPRFGGRVQVMGGDYGSGSLGLIVNEPVTSLDSAWRLSVQKFRSNGYRYDPYLDRDATNGFDEFSGHFKWRWQPSQRTHVDFALLQSTLDNGYDAWSIDNSWRSEADQPGVDTQHATGGSVHLVTSWSPATLTVNAAVARSKSVNSYDDDWGNPQLWAPYTDSYFTWSERDRHIESLEARLASPAPKAAGQVAWLAGVYGLHLAEDGLDRTVGIYRDPFDASQDGSLDDHLVSDYRANTLALYGQLNGRISPHWVWSAGLRLEQREARYLDAGISGGAPQATDLGARDRMTGGALSLNYEPTPTTTWYASLSRGYKAGGFNLGRVPPDRLEFKPEFLWDLEGGLKRSWLDGRLYTATTLFYMWRRDVQFLTSEQLNPNDPSSFVFFTDNAASGENYGLESSLRYAPSRRWDFTGSVGLLRTRYHGYHQGEVLEPDRAQPSAPAYQLSFSGTWHGPAGWTARLDLSAVDSFYFDMPPNNTQSNSYALANLKAGYDGGRWSAYVWVRNLFNTYYAVRGFYFGDEPPDFPNKLYVQRGDPRHFGVTFDYSFD